MSFNYAILKYYTDPHEAVSFTLWIQVMAFSGVMIYILLIPFDVFAAVRHFHTVIQFTDPVFGYSHEVTIYDPYFLCYIVMIYMTFIGLPFPYFYAQSVQDEEELNLNMKMRQAVEQPDEEGPTPDYSSLGMKKFDSSDSSDGEDDLKKKDELEAQDIDIELTNGKSAEKPYKRGKAAKQQLPSLEEAADLKESSDKKEEGALDKCLNHSKKAIKKTVSVCFILTNISDCLVRVPRGADDHQLRGFRVRALRSRRRVLQSFRPG